MTAIVCAKSHMKGLIIMAKMLTSIIHPQGIWKPFFFLLSTVLSFFSFMAMFILNYGSKIRIKIVIPKQTEKKNG